MENNKNKDLLDIVRRLKAQGHDDETIVKQLEPNHPRQQIDEYLKALSYMRPIGAETASVTGTSVLNSASQDVVRMIIRRRKNSTLKAIILTVIIFPAMAAYGFFDTRIKNAESLMLFILTMGTFIILILLFVYKINAINSQLVKPSYRFWNKIIYSYAMRIFALLSFFNAIISVLSFLNPMHGFKNPSAASRSSLLIEAAFSTAAGVQISKQLKPAAYVEQYFKQTQSR